MNNGDLIQLDVTKARIVYVFDDATLVSLLIILYSLNYFYVRWQNVSSTASLRNSRNHGRNPNYCRNGNAKCQVLDPTIKFPSTCYPV